MSSKAITARFCHSVNHTRKIAVCGVLQLVDVVLYKLKEGARGHVDRIRSDRCALHKITVALFHKAGADAAVFVLFKIQVLRPCLMADFAAFVVDTGITDVCPDCGLVIVNRRADTGSQSARTSEVFARGRVASHRRDSSPSISGDPVVQS